MKRILLSLITAVILFLIPNVNFGQAPTLGTTSTFALFAAVGAFENTGASVVTGDVGTNVGAFSAFPPGVLVGQKHVLDPASTTAATDVLVAYGSLAALTPLDVLGVNLGGPGETTLGPGVHKIGAASTLNGTLTLDGGGDPNALFIFQINGALATTANSRVELINSANPCNVYWQINGQFDLQTYSVFVGTVIAEGPINLFVGSSLYGRALATSGAINVHTAVVTVPVCALLPPTAPTAPTVTVTQPTCVVATGTITVTAPAGMVYCITGTHNSNTTGIFTLPAGTYAVTAKDSNGNISSGTSFTINAQPAKPAAPTVTLVQSTCDVATGTITITAPKGTGFTYSIDGSNYTNTTGIFTQVPAGTYTVTAKSSSGCISSR